MNDTDLSVTEIVDTHSFQGLTKYLTVTKIHSDATHCLIANCYICQKLITQTSNAHGRKILFIKIFCVAMMITEVLFIMFLILSFFYDTRCMFEVSVPIMNIEH